MSARVLYYPWMDVHHVEWLKTALLYWDEVSTLVPEGTPVWRQHPETAAAVDAGFLTALELHPDEDVVRGADAALHNRLGKEWIRTLNRAERSPSNDPFSATWPLEMTMTISQGKLPFTSVTRSNDPGDAWVRLPTSRAALYLSALAVRAAEKYGLPLYTGEAGLAPWVESLHLGTTLRDDVIVPARYGDPTGSEVRLRWQGGLNTNAQEARNIHRGVPPLVLVHTALDGISVKPSTDIKKIIKFRERHQDELRAFREEMENLARELGRDDYKTVEAMEEIARQIVKTRLQPARDNLKKARLANGIEIGRDIFKAASVSPAPALGALLIGIPPLALALAIAVPGITIGLTLARRFAQRDPGSADPFSYVVSLEKKFGRDISGMPLKHIADVQTESGGPPT